MVLDIEVEIYVDLICMGCLEENIMFLLVILEGENVVELF